MGEGAGDGVEELFHRMRPSDRMRVSLCSFPPFFCKEGPAGEGGGGMEGGRGIEGGGGGGMGRARGSGREQARGRGMEWDRGRGM